MKDMTMDNSNTMNMLLDAIISARFDLIMLAIGLMGYYVLSLSRSPKAAKNFHKKIDVTDEDSEVIEANQEADVAEVVDDASHRLSQIVDRIRDCSTEGQTAAMELDAFLLDYPQHPFTLHEVQAVLGYCRSSVADKSLADSLLERMEPTEDWDILSAFIGFYLYTKQSEHACDLFELNYATFFDIELDDNMQWGLLTAALECQRGSLAEHLLQTSQIDLNKNLVTIQRWWKRSAAQMGERRVAHMGNVLNRISQLFNEQYPFEEHSDDESTCFLGDDSDREESDSDSTWEDVY